MSFANGYSMAMAYNTDLLGTLYGCVAAVWTICLCLGAAFLISNRKQPCVQLRNVPLSLSVVSILHVYWILCLLAYMLQGHFPCGVEFWIMSIYLPLGMALFHVANTQLLRIVMVQKQYLYTSIPMRKDDNHRTTPGSWKKNVSWVHCNDKAKKTVGRISCFMLLQLMITVLIYLASRKFHPHFGLTTPGFEAEPADSEVCNAQLERFAVTSCDAAKKMACRRGWEWYKCSFLDEMRQAEQYRMPSIAWQFFWCWIYAPYLLWRLQGVKDVHGWRKQTIACCLAGLPATPMWLAALYVPEMKHINRYYIPPMWFVPSIFLIEAFFIFIPCVNILKNRKLDRSTDFIIKEWQQKRRKSVISLCEGSTLVEAASSHDGSTVSAPSMHRGRMYSMEALETTLRQNPQPLLQFASLRDFSGENVSFLVHVMNWKLGWLPSSPVRGSNAKKTRIMTLQGESLRRHQYEQAIDIYVSFVSLKFSEYPINLSHAHYKQLEDVLGNAASLLHKPTHTQTDTVTPFNDWIKPPSMEFSMPTEQTNSNVEVPVNSSITNAGQNDSRSNVASVSRGQGCINQTSTSGRGIYLPSTIPIPDAFGPQVFDDAEKDIKYMVLTNTWCKFVKERETTINKKKFMEQVREALV